MRTSLEAFFGWIGLVAQLAGYLAYASSLVVDPFYALIGTIAGLCFSAWLVVSAFTDKVPSKIVSGDDGSKPAAWTYRKSRGVRIMACLMLIASFVAFAGMVIYERERVFDVADAGRPTFLNSCHAMIAARDAHAKKGATIHLPLQDCLPDGPLDIEIATDLAQAGHGVKFTIRKRPRVPWVQVDEVRVEIESFEKVPEIRSVICGLRVPTNIYFAEIDDPAILGRPDVEARFVSVDDSDPNIESPAADSVLFLQDDLPEPFLVIVAARSPGLYKYRVEVDVSYLWQSQTLLICDGVECIYNEKGLSQAEQLRLEQQGPIPSAPAEPAPATAPEAT